MDKEQIKELAGLLTDLKTELNEELDLLNEESELTEKQEDRQVEIEETVDIIEQLENKL